MAIRNNLLGGNDIQENEVEFKSVDYNDTNNELVRHNVNNYRANILNTIRQLQDRTISFSADGGEWAEAYTDVTGRLNSVSYEEGEYSRIVNGITHALDGITINSVNTNSVLYPYRMFDGDSDSYAYQSPVGAGTTYFGYMLPSETYINNIRIKASSKVHRDGSGNQETSITLQYHDGSDWVTESVLASDSGTSTQIEESYDGTYTLNKNVYGIRLGLNINVASGSDPWKRVFLLGETRTPADATIVHNIPSGTLPANISSCVGSPLVAPSSWETGADIQYKLTNATEDTGWLDSNKIENFTAFTSEPEQCIVKLIPKETDPTLGVPAISGFGLRGDTI